MKSELEKFLRDHVRNNASSAVTEYGIINTSYAEHCNDDAIDGDRWLETGTSYIWKVGLLGVVDSNKADWGWLHIAHQRDDESKPEIIGALHWAQGENDDVGRCLQRYVYALNASHTMDSLFQVDDEKQLCGIETPEKVIELLKENGYLDGAKIRADMGKSDSLDSVSVSDILELIRS